MAQKKTCTGCKGKGIRYLIDHGDYLDAKTWQKLGRPLADKVTCPTCNGKGTVNE